MCKTIILLPDGREISSGQPGTDAVKSFSLTESVNEGKTLNLGAVCAAMAEIELFAPEGSPIQTGDQLVIFSEDGAGNRQQVGIFLAEKPENTGTVRVTAYDRVILLDRDLTDWLEKLTDWPYSLGQFGQMVCAACGVTPAAGELPNADLTVQKFAAAGVTGRQLLHWVAELAGRFCRCTPAGELEFAWYVPSGIVLTPSGDHYYLQSGFSRADYETARIDQVQIRQNEEDVGTVFPPSGSHVWRITGNPLASAEGSETLIGVAQTLYEQLRSVSYTPCKIRLPEYAGVHCGDIVRVQDSAGGEHTVYVMNRNQSGGKDVLECTGTLRRDSSGAVNQTNIKTLTGKILNLQTTVDGLRAENRDAMGKMAALSMNVDGITSEVSRQQTELGGVRTALTAISQNAQRVDVRIREMTEEGVQKVKTETGFTLDAKGLTISREGTRMENLLNETGMYVRRQGEVILQADQAGVKAVDVSVENYLIVGDHARFEDYHSGSDLKRTACFWI